MTARVHEIAAEPTPEGVEELAQLMEHGAEVERVAAAEALLDLAWGPTDEIYDEPASAGGGDDDER